jgi:Ala-tRNA(Pro) deacylase
VLLCDERPVLALVPGDRRVDPAKVARTAGASGARIASPEEVRNATGFEPGAVAPFPLPAVELVVLERTLLRHRIVWAGAGSERHLVGLAPGELARLARARSADLVQESSSAQAAR